MARRARGAGAVFPESAWSQWRPDYPKEASHPLGRHASTLSQWCRGADNLRVSAKATSQLAWGAAVVVLALSGAAQFLSGDPGGAVYNVIPVILAGLGVLIAIRQPRNAIGWILLGVATAFAANTLAGAGASYSQPASGGPSDWTIWLDWVQTWLWLSYLPGGLVLLFLLLPDGRLLGRRWRYLVWFDVLYVPVLMVVTALDPAQMQVTSGPTIANPVGQKLLAGVHGNGGLGFVFHSPLPVLLVLTIVALILRLVRSRGEERQQLKWIVYASAAAIIAEVAANVISAAGLDPNGTIYGLTAFLALGVVLPTSFGVAILKYGLYEIDVFISRTLVYGALAAFITAVYVGIVVGIGSLIGGGGKPNLVLSIFATAVVALGFQPLRDRLQKVANRLVYGQRATPYEVLSEFSERVAESYGGGDVIQRMAQVLQEGTGAESATVWLRSAGHLDPAATQPEAAVGYLPIPVGDGVLPEIPDASRAVAVRHQEELLGALTVVKRRGESLTPIEEKLVTDLAHQAGLVLKNVGLTADLQRRLEELRASRQRLVAAPGRGAPAPRAQPPRWGPAEPGRHQGQAWVGRDADGQGPAEGARPNNRPQGRYGRGARNAAGPGTRYLSSAAGGPGFACCAGGAGAQGDFTGDGRRGWFGSLSTGVGGCRLFLRAGGASECAKVRESRLRGGTPLRTRRVPAVRDPGRRARIRSQEAGQRCGADQHG